MDSAIGHLAKGDIHIKDGAIVAIGPALARPPRARVITANQMIAMPGLIDTHSHLWNTPTAFVGRRWSEELFSDA